MLEMRPTCENCAKLLPNSSNEAMICSFECTFCLECVSEQLHNVCPNCGGGFEKRPTRPHQLLEKYPVSTETKINPVNFDKFKTLLAKNIILHPRKR